MTLLASPRSLNCATSLSKGNAAFTMFPKLERTFLSVPPAKIGKDYTREQKFTSITKKVKPQQ